MTLCGGHNLAPSCDTGEIRRQPSLPELIRGALIFGVLISPIACGSRTKSSETTATPASSSTTSVQTSASVPSTTTSATTPPTSAADTSTTAATTTTIDSVTAIAQITQNWEKFFLAGTPLAEREALLENGAQYEQALTFRAADPLQAQASATVRDVTLTDATSAHVTYDVSLSGTVALPGAEGNALLQDGTWKVSAESFCSLIALGATEPIPGCS